MKKAIYIFILTAFILVPLGSAAAQTETPPAIMAPAAVPVDQLLDYEVQQYLSAHPPAGTNLYAITEISDGPHGVYISLAGLRPDRQPPYDWGMEDNDTVIWTGTLKKVAGVISPFTVGDTCHNCARRTAGPGGGSDIYFPWQAGKKMLMGPRGVHGAGDFGTTGMVAIDWVSGDDFGGNAANNTVYASAGGTIDYICHGTLQSAIRVTDGTTIVLYAHLIYNSNMTIGHTYVRGEPIGVLKYGAFNESCGWAEQSANHYHLHWMIVPAGGRYRAESWSLTTALATWNRGNEQIKVNMWMTGGGGTGPQLPNPGPDDPPSDPGGPIVIDPQNPANLRLSGVHFWDYVIGGLNSLYVSLVLNNLPPTLSSEESDQTWDLATTMTATMIRDANTILVNDTINFLPVLLLVLLIIIIETAMRVIGIILLVMTLIKAIPFIP